MSYASGICIAVSWMFIGGVLVILIKWRTRALIAELWCRYYRECEAARAAEGE